MKLSREEYERLSAQEKRQYLDGLNPQEFSEMFATLPAPKAKFSHAFAAPTVAKAGEVESENVSGPGTENPKGEESQATAQEKAIFPGKMQLRRITISILKLLGGSLLILFMVNMWTDGWAADSLESHLPTWAHVFFFPFKVQNFFNSLSSPNSSEWKLGMMVVLFFAVCGVFVMLKEFLQNGLPVLERPKWAAGFYICCVGILLAGLWLLSQHHGKPTADQVVDRIMSLPLDQRDDALQAMVKNGEIPMKDGEVDPAFAQEYATIYFRKGIPIVISEMIQARQGNKLDDAAFAKAIYSIVLKARGSNVDESAISDFLKALKENNLLTDGVQAELTLLQKSSEMPQPTGF